MANRAPREATPQAQLQALAEALERGGLVRGYAARGAERYFRERALALVRARAERDGFELCVHDAADPDFALQSLHDDMSSGSLFGAPRCVVVRGGDALLAPSADGAEGLARTLVAFLASRVAGALVLVCEALALEHPVLAAIQKCGGTIVGCRRLWETAPPWDPDPRRAELVQWTAQRARELGLRLDAAQALYVVVATGNDLSAIEGELEKLKRAGGRALRDVVGWQAGASPWALADDLCAGAAARALSALEALFGAGFQARDGARVVDRDALANVLAGAIGQRVRQSLALASALAEGQTPEQAAKGAGMKGAPETREAAVRRALARSAAQWGAMQAEILGLERRQRSGAPLDANDFAELALRWAQPEGAPGRPAPARRG